jgi:hypothetical protein
MRKIVFWLFTIVIIGVTVAFTFTSMPLLIKAIPWALAIIMTYATLQYQRTSKPIYEKTVFWILAIVITVSTAVYQRLTGPTHPVDSSVEFAGQTVTYSLPRSHGGEGGPDIVLTVENPTMQAKIHHKRYKVPETFTIEDMTASGDSLIGTLPHQPPAGKLEYYVELLHEDKSIFIPGPETIVIRFKGDVPMAALIPHVFLMFFGMLWSNRTGLEALSTKGSTRSLTLWTTAILFAGGMIMGPVVQKFAFGAFWTGVPWGWDLTDNKTLIFVVIWIAALWRHRSNLSPRYFVLAAAIITFIMYMIPHSMMGSELDYTTGEVKTG